MKLPLSSLKPLAMLLQILALTLVASCSDVDLTSPELKSIAVTVNAILTVGQSAQASATLTDVANRVYVVQGDSVAWSSSDTKVATVSPSGMVTGIGTGAASITATSVGKSGNASITVANAPLAGDPIEPVFSATTQKLLFKDEFDYVTFADANANGWHGTDGSNTSDTRFTPDPLGANQIIVGGYDGTGHAMRLKYNGVETNTGTNQEARNWSRLQPDALAATPGHAFYISYYFRITPGGGFVLDQDPQHIVQVKWLQLWNSTGGSRLEFDTSYSHCYQDVPKIGAGGSGTLWHVYGNSAGGTQCQAGQVRAPFAYQGQGQWHRATHKYMTKSTTTARDGIAQMWLDGTMIVDSNAADCGKPVPNAQSLYKGAAPTWCMTDDLDAMMTQETVARVALGGPMTNSLWPFTIDYDHMTMWRDP